MRRLALPVAQLTALYFNAHFVERDDKGKVKDPDDLMEPADFIPGMATRKETQKLQFRPGDIPIRFDDLRKQLLANPLVKRAGK